MLQKVVKAIDFNIFIVNNMIRDCNESQPLKFIHTMAKVVGRRKKGSNNIVQHHKISGSALLSFLSFFFISCIFSSFYFFKKFI